jgi:hypothetical protein
VEERFDALSEALSELELRVVEVGYFYDYVFNLMEE